MLTMQGVLLALVLRLCWAQVVFGESCESAGLCEETEACRSEPLTDCFHGKIIVDNDKKYPSYETSRTADSSIISSRQKSCEVKVGWTSKDRTDMTLESLKLDYVSRTPKYVSVCASWNITKSSGQNGGFVVKVVDDYGDFSYQFCVTDPTSRRICINNFQYSNMHIERYIEVYPFPLNGDDIIADKKKSVKIRKLAGCVDADHNVGTCSPKLYRKPENLTVRSSLCDEGKKDLSISWQPPIGAEELPEVYFMSVYILSGTLWKSLRVINSSQVMLRNLSGSVNYSVEVQAYGRCVGLGDFYTTGDALGCGKPTHRIAESLTECTRTTSPTSYAIEENDTAVPSENRGTNNRPLEGPLLHITIVFSVVGAVLIAAGLVVVILCAAVRHVQRTSLRSIVYPQVPQKPRVFVFYSPSMCESRLRSVQERIVCLLLEYFDVVTPDDISSGNMSMWMEETVKSVHSVFLVANKEFCCDWMRSKDERLPVVNSLELLISSAAAQNSIGRFGFVSVEDSTQDVFVPDHSYLKLMPVFLLGQNKGDINKLYQFVTKSRGIELRMEDT